eukprot:scaffold130170_cov26-Tisochrysis_lutea.AAC.4
MTPTTMCTTHTGMPSTKEDSARLATDPMARPRAEQHAAFRARVPAKTLAGMRRPTLRCSSTPKPPAAGTGQEE